MSEHLQEDQLKKIEDVQKQKLLHFQQQETIHKTIHKNLTGLQSWDLAQGQTLEERREAHKEAMIHDQLQENAAMQNAAQAQLAQANANAAAPGAPVQEQAPAKQTHKKRMERGWKAKRARISCPYGTADSYDCEEAISRVIQERKNARKSVSKDTKGIYPDVLGTFCQGYKVNWRGKPATPEDQAKADSDNAFLKAYLSMDLKKRKPYLEAFHKELMDFPLSADSVSEAYLIQNVDAVKRITDKSIYFDIIMKDPINKPYFDSLSPAEKELLKEKLSMMENFRIHFLDRMSDLGVDASTGRYYNDNSIIRDRASARRVKEERSELTAGWEQKKREILERHMENEAAQERERKLRGIAEDQAEQTTHRPENMNFSSPAAGYATDELKRYRAMIEDNPDAYVANQPLIDQLYQELYRNMDILNDFVFDSMVYQGVYDEKNESPNSTDKALAKLAFEKVERCMNSIDAVRKKSDPIGQALEFCLKGKSLTNGARALLESMGPNGEALSLLDRQRTVQKIFLGENGAIANSNAALKNAKESGKAPAEARSDALQALGIRVSTTPAAMANNDLREDAFIQLPKEIAEKFHEIEGQGTDLAAMQEQMKKDYLPKSQNGYVTGGGVDAVNEDLLALYGTYLNSDKSVQYLKFMCETLKDAEVFSGDSGEALAFLSQSLLNSFGANFTVVNNTQDSYQKGAVVRTVALESCRTLLSLPAMTRLSEEERAKLPEATQKLAAQYAALMRQVLQKVDPAAAEP